MSNREKAAKSHMSRNESVTVAEKTVTIPEREYNSLKAAAELVAHPDVLLRTLSALGKPRGESLEEAFAETEPKSREAGPAEETRPKRSGLKSA